MSMRVELLGAGMRVLGHVIPSPGIGEALLRREAMRRMLRLRFVPEKETRDATNEFDHEVEAEPARELPRPKRRRV